MLQDKVVRIKASATIEEAFYHFNNMAAAYGYSNNVYTLMTDHPSINQKAHHGLATTYPSDWIDFYNANGYQRIDAIWDRLLKSPAPFFWAEHIDQFTKDDRIPEERRRASVRLLNEAEDAGIADGIGISFVSPSGEIAGIGLSRSKPESTRSHEELAEIYLLAAYFHETFLSFYERSRPRLTQREREVLLWAAEGKTDFDISCTLNVSASTIRFHWTNIFDKLGVRGRVRAIVKAMQLRLVAPQALGARSSRSQRS